MNQKIIIAILGVIIIILLGTTIYFATINNVSQPTPDPVAQKPIQQTTPLPVVETANQKIYTSTKSAFSVSVPREWTYTEQMPAPFVATEFFDDKNKSTRLLLIDRFETNEKANADIIKDLITWAKEDMANDRSANGYKDPGCKDGTAQLAIRNDNYKAVIIDCPKRDTESYVIFTQDRHYLIESPLKYKNANIDIYNNIYKSFKIN